MNQLRSVTALIVLAFLATTAVPCFASGMGDEAAMACCLAMGHDDCNTPRLADACCQAGDANQHDRDVTPAAPKVTYLVAAAALPAVSSPIELPAIFRLRSVVPQAALFAISPARHCPLLI